MKKKKVADAGITTVADMKQQDDEQLLTLSAAMVGVSHAKLVQWRNSFAHPGSCPYKIIDYQMESNP